VGEKPNAPAGKRAAQRWLGDQAVKAKLY